jgi:hypothetical protein
MVFKACCGLTVIAIEDSTVARPSPPAAAGYV